MSAYRAFRGGERWFIAKELACINGLNAWFNYAALEEASPEETGYSDGAFPTAADRAEMICQALNSKDESSLLRAIIDNARQAFAETHADDEARCRAMAAALHEVDEVQP